MENDFLEENLYLDENECFFSDDEDLKNLKMDDSLQIYLKEIGKYKIHSPEYQRILLEEAKTGNKEARKELINSNLRLVVSIAKRYLKNNSSFTLLDLIQEGNIGLMKTIEKFDLTYDINFASYATYWIIQSIERAIGYKDKIIRIPVSIQLKHKKFLEYIEKYIETFHKFPSDEELLKNLNVSTNILYHLKELANLKPVSIETKIKPEEASGELGAFLASESEEYEVLETNIDQKLFLCAIKSVLRPIEYYIIYYRFYYSPNKTLEEMAKEFYVVRQRLDKIERNAMKKIKNNFYDFETQCFDKKIIIEKHKHLLDENIEPTFVNDIVLMYILKQNLSEFEYYIIYYLYFNTRKYTISKLSNILKISLSELKSIYDYILKKYSNIINLSDKHINNYKKILLKEQKHSINQLLSIDISPTYKVSLEDKELKETLSKTKKIY